MVDRFEQTAGDVAEGGLKIQHEMEALETIALFGEPTNLKV